MSLVFPYEQTAEERPLLGLIVLQSDETVEEDFRALVPDALRLLVSRVPSGLTVSAESLSDMEHHLTEAASLFPRGLTFDAIGYACTSGSAQIGPDRVADRIRAGAPVRAVSNPVTALSAACKAAGIARLGLLSPYVKDVSETLRAVLAQAGVETPVFGTFNEAEEAKVARIDEESLMAGARGVMAGAQVDGLFLSCTNLRTLGVIPRLEDAFGLPVLSSNLVLAWDMIRLAGGAVSAPSALLSGVAEGGA